MPHRDQATVSAWVREFSELGHAMGTSVDVLPHEEEAGDTGLIVVRLREASTVTYLHTVTRETVKWVVVFEAREDAMELDAAAISQLAADLALVSALCGFLQAKTDAAADA